MFTQRRVIVVFVVFLLLFTFVGLSKTFASTPRQDTGTINVPPPDPVSPNLPTAAMLGAAVSFILAFIPGVQDWFGGLENTTKSAILIVLTLIVGVLLFLRNNGFEGVAHLQLLDLAVFAQNFLIALAASQAQFKVNKQLQKPREQG